MLKCSLIGNATKVAKGAHKPVSRDSCHDHAESRVTNVSERHQLDPTYPRRLELLSRLRATSAWVDVGAGQTTKVWQERLVETSPCAGE